MNQIAHHRGVLNRVRIQHRWGLSMLTQSDAAPARQHRPWAVLGRAQSAEGRGGKRLLFLHLPFDYKAVHLDVSTGMLT